MSNNEIKENQVVEEATNTEIIEVQKTEPKVITFVKEHKTGICAGILGGMAFIAGMAFGKKKERDYIMEFCSESEDKSEDKDDEEDLTVTRF